MKMNHPTHQHGLEIFKGALRPAVGLPDPVRGSSLIDLGPVSALSAFGQERDWAPIYALPCDESPATCNPDLPQGSRFDLDLAGGFEVPVPAGFLWWIYWAQIALGWFLSALLVAVLTGLVKRE